MSKPYTKICKKYETDFGGYKVPLGAIYGKTANKVLYVCETPRDIKENIMHIFLSKSEWGNNATTENKTEIRWNYTIIPASHEIFQAVKSACYELGYIPKVTCYYEPERRKREKWEREHARNTKMWELEKARREKERALKEKYALSPADLPTMRMPSEPMARTGKQSLVDGKGYSIEWEENYISLSESNPEGYKGCPVEYSGNNISMKAETTNTCFMSFEGTGSTRRDGMKVKQTKIRPEKKNKDFEVKVYRNDVLIK